MSNAAKNFDILATGLSAPHNYFDSAKIIFPAKSLDLSAKPFFPFMVSFLYLFIVSGVQVRQTNVQRFSFNVSNEKKT